MEKIAAFDIGDKRIGVAFSDPFGEYALPSETYFRTGNFLEDVAQIARIARSAGAERIVCGLPLNADGTESVQTQKTLRFIEALKAETALPVEAEDERFTTLSARRDLVQMGVSARKDKQKKAVDSLAAAYILESYLEKRRKSMKEEREDYDEENNIVELVDEEGNSVHYEHLMTFEYKGEWYCAFTPAGEADEAPEDDGEEGDEVVIYRLKGGEDDETLEPIEDDEKLDEVFAEFCNQYEDFEDAEEAASLEPDADDAE